MRDEELFYTLALLALNGIGSIKARQLLTSTPSAKQAFELAVKSHQNSHEQALHTAEKTLKQIQTSSINTVRIDEPDYPPLLADCPDAPILLFYIGDISVAKSKPVAIVGTRRPSHEALQLTRELVEGIKDVANICVVSGLAFGIDREAHTSALHAGIPTVAVIPSALPHIYPRAHTHLAHTIAEHGGAVVSEVPPGTPLSIGYFPRRNRLIAGMSRATIVVEAGSESGALLTAHLAHGYGRQVFAVPGSPKDPRRKGCNTLIKTQIARLLEEATDLLQFFNWQSKGEPAQKHLPASPHEKAIYEALLRVAPQPLHADQLSEATGIPPHELPSHLLSMELKGLITALPGNYYQLA